MASYYRTLTFTTTTVNAGATYTSSQTIASNIADIVKIKVVPSNTNTGEVASFTLTKHNTFLDSDMCYAALNFAGNLIDPIESDGGMFTERTEGFVCKYTDLDNATELNVKIVNGGIINKTYTVTVEYIINEDLRGYINVMDYGATGNGTTNDTTAIQNAINACASLYTTQAGTVWFPPGTYLIDAITMKAGANLKGSGMGATILKSNSAVIMLAISTSSSVQYYVEDMTLWGNSVGTKALEFTGNANTFILNRLVIQNFTTCGIHIGDALIFGVRDCFIFASVIGILIDSVHNNSIYIEGTQIKSNPTYGVKATGGNLIVFRSCDIEGNGTHANNATGGVYASGLNGDATYMGLVIEDCWFESNYGHAEIEIGQPSNGGFQETKVMNTIISGGNAPYGFYASGNQTMYTLDNVSSFSHTTSDIADDGTVLRGALYNCLYNVTSTAGTVSLFPWADQVTYPGNNGPNYMGRGLNVGALLQVQSATGTPGSTNASTITFNASSSNVSKLTATHIGTGTTRPLGIYSDATLVSMFTVNGGNGQLLVNTASTDFTSAIFASYGTMAVVTGATNAQVLAFNASGGDGNAQIVTTHSGTGSTVPLEFFSDSTLIASITSTTFGFGGTAIAPAAKIVASTGVVSGSLFNTTSTSGGTLISTGTGTVKMATANNANNTVWIPMEYQGTSYFVPGWSTNAP